MMNRVAPVRPGDDNDVIVIGLKCNEYCTDVFRVLTRHG